MSWHELRLDPFIELRAVRHDPLTGMLVGVEIQPAWQVPTSDPISTFPFDCLVIFPERYEKRIVIGECTNVRQALWHLEYFVQMGPMFEKDETVVTRLETASMVRLAAALCVELRSKFARMLFRMLRGRVFRRRIHRRVRAKLLLVRHSQVALPKELVRHIADAWLF